MIRTLALLCVAILFAVPSVRADDNTMSSKDSKFVMEAIAGGETEVALGKLAVDKGSSADVKAFGQKMIEDHTKANDELKELAKSKNLDLKKGEDRAIKMEQKNSDKLTKKSGDEFDKAYVDLMVKDHEKDVKDFEKASKDSDDADLKAWAAKTLPTLQEHLQSIKDIQAKMEK